MKRLHGFADIEVARRLRESVVLAPTESQSPEILYECDAWLIRTPAAGIAAFAGYDDADETDTVPSAMCKAWRLYKDESGNVKRRPMVDGHGDPLEILVANLDSEAIPGNAWGGCTKYIGGVRLIDWFDCNA